MYYKGHGFDQENTNAIECFKKAAEQGHADAQYNLGVIYLNGHGVFKDYNQAKQYFEKAEAKGIALLKII